MRNLALLAGSALSVLASSPPVPRKFIYLISDRPSGTMHVTQQGQERSFAFGPKDRGRGVGLRQVFAIGPARTIRQMSIKDFHYLKVPLEELFSVEVRAFSSKSQT